MNLSSGVIQAVAVLLLAGAALGQTSTGCTGTTACGGTGVCNKTICANCELITTCTPSTAPPCPTSVPIGGQCSFGSQPDGCGATIAGYTCPCTSGSHCDTTSGNCVANCPPSCTTTFTANNGVETTFTGICALSQPTNTVDGGPGDCPTACGRCYVSSYLPALCNTQAGSACATNGHCGCFNTNGGASCSPSNFATPKPSPLPGNGGGCSENLCNALATKVGRSAACCPQGCK